MLGQVFAPATLLRLFLISLALVVAVLVVLAVAGGGRGRGPDVPDHVRRPPRRRR